MPSLQGTAPSTPEGAAASPRKGRTGTIRTSVQGNWTPYTRAYECRACARVFSTLVRKHHCRGCGEVFCDACTTPRVLGQAPALVDRLGATRPQRLCSACKACMPDPAAASSPTSRLTPSDDGVVVSASPATLATQELARTGTAIMSAKETDAGHRHGSRVTSLEHVVATAVNIVDAVNVETVTSVASGVGNAFATASASGVVDMAGQALSGLLAVAERFPLGSQCCGLLKDMFALYQVCCTITGACSSTSICECVCGWGGGYSLDGQPVECLE